MIKRLQKLLKLVVAKKPRRKRRTRRERRGVALVLVLTSLTLMTILLTSVQDETSAELGDAVTSRDALKAEYAARSAINLSRLLIAAEQPVIRPAVGLIYSMLSGGKKIGQIPVWERAEALLGAFNDKSSVDSFAALTGISLDEAKNLGLDGARFEVKIVDEDSKINVNLAAKNLPNPKLELATKLAGLMEGTQYDTLFERRDADGQFTSKQALCSALVDWADSDMDEYACDVTGQSGSYTGAEDAFYQLLDTPYPRKNAAFDSVEELRMVRGMGDDYWATFVEPDPWDAASRTLTVWGQGKVNVNTANPFTILATVRGELCQDEEARSTQPLCTDPQQSMYFLQMLGVIKSFTAGVPFFSSSKHFINTISGRGKGLGSGLKTLAEAMFPEFVFPVFKSPAQAGRSLTTTSEVFSIVATGIVKSGKRETRRRVTAVVDFRGAPQALIGPTAEQLAEASAAAVDAGANPDVANFYKPTAGGNIIYFRVD